MKNAAFAEAVARIDRLLEQRVAEYPVRVESSYAQRRAAIDALTDSFLADAPAALEATQPDVPPSWIDRPVFICGSAKSGTTLITQLLDGHPELVVMPGDSFFVQERHAYISRDFEALARKWIGRLVSPTGLPPFWMLGRAREPYEQFVAHLRHALSAGCLEPFLCVVLAFHAANPTRPASTQRWVEKTPNNELHAPDLAVQFPQARFIHVLRDPLANLTSLKRLQSHHGQPFDLPRRAMKMRRLFKACRINLRQLGSHRYLVLRYEDIVADPTAAGRRIADFLSIADEPCLSQPTCNGAPASANSMYRQRRVVGQITSQEPRSRIQEELTPDELAAGVTLLWRDAARMGYRWDADLLAHRRGATNGFLRYRLAPAVRRRIAAR